MFLRIATSSFGIQRNASIQMRVCFPVQAAESESLNGLNRLRQISPMDASESLTGKI
jgi:hypothetical protein